MTGRSVTIELDHDQAALLDEIAAGQQVSPDKLLLEAVAHGLAMIVAGIEDDGLHDATRDPPRGDCPEPLPPLPKERQRRSRPGERESKASGEAENRPTDPDDDLPF